MHASTEATTRTATTSDDRSVGSDGLVDLYELVCPGCGNAVSPEPPVDMPGETSPMERHVAGQEFCHQDGSELCRDARGRMGEPVEVTRRARP
jgi:hypothetical protein